jgi:hypothetical protein
MSMFEDPDMDEKNQTINVNEEIAENNASYEKAIQILQTKFRSLNSPVDLHNSSITSAYTPVRINLMQNTHQI